MNTPCIGKGLYNDRYSFNSKIRGVTYCSLTKIAAIPFDKLAKIAFLVYNTRTHHTAPNTHARHKNLLLFTFGLRKCCGDLSRASAAQGVTNGDGTTDGIDNFERNVKMLDGHDCLRREGLMEHVRKLAGYHRRSKRTSLISKKSTSSLDMPAFSRTLGIANAGPILQLALA